MNIGEMQRLLSQKAEQAPDHRFDDLYSLVRREDWLRLAHEYVAQNTGSKTAGCDGIDMSEFEADLERNLAKLRQALQSDIFVACPVRRVYIPKANGKVRPLGIPSIRDRIVQEAVRMVLEPIYEADFSQYSFGFRPTRCTMDAIKCITWTTQESKKFFWTIEGDISAYFDTICHRKLISLLRKRVQDERLLSLIWKFLRAGVMERKLFKNTKLGTPQGGIISPLLANVYLHELDKYMEKYTGLSRVEKTERRKAGLANYVYIRYADDFVILCNGSKAQAEEMRAEVRNYLSSELRLTLSMEKTKITHLNDGFDFLGFHIQRSMGHNGMKTKVLISKKGTEKHLNALRAATSSNSHEDSVRAKIKAVNRIIAGWCRYYQYTSKASNQFGRLEYKSFWMMAHWLGRKFKLRMTQVMVRFNRKHSSKGEEASQEDAPSGKETLCREKRLRMVSLGEDGVYLLRHNGFPTLRYKERFLKPNPYTTQEKIKREELPDETSWLGFEDRPGWADIAQQARKRDNWTCRVCKTEGLTTETCEVDHIIPYSRFKRPVDANRLNNLSDALHPLPHTEDGV